MYSPNMYETGSVSSEPSDAWSPSSTPSSSCSSSSTSGSGWTCKVCGVDISARNLSIDVCRACAAFFRRTVMDRKQYKCKALRSCYGSGGPISPKLPACKHCRFRKCVLAGLEVERIRCASIAEASRTRESRSPLVGLIEFRNALFLKRATLLSVEGSYPEARYETPTKASCQLANVVELRLLEEYLNKSDGLQSFPHCDVDTAVIARHYFLVWDLFETVLMTARHKGFHKGVVFFTDERCLETVPDSLENYYRSYPPLPSADVLARHSSEKWKPVLSLAEKLHRLQLETVELVSLERMLFATYESAFFKDDKARIHFTNSVLRDLNDYCLNHSLDFTLSFDRVSSLIAEFQEAFHSYCELLTMLDFYSPLLPEAESEFCILEAFRFRKECRYVS